ncbi:MAG: hypothetical protein LBD11_05090 [Candidatus Peribacteria bacterium]|jgi:hypothetical protein|nr:hypothetical protein [Candidatus Peribacteria bacterium]
MDKTAQLFQIRETLQQLKGYRPLEETKALLAEVLDEESFKQGLKSFFAVKGMKNPFLYEACKRSGLMDTYGEPAVQRLVIKELLALTPEEIEKNSPGNILSCYLAEIVKKKYTVH